MVSCSIKSVHTCSQVKMKDSFTMKDHIGNWDLVLCPDTYTFGVNAKLDVIDRLKFIDQNY